jgi:glycosyltransferase involved in cell wall biosynthesis
MIEPIISVVIDTYNHERYIEQCILSAIEQDFPASEYEIVVVDDGSTDRTPEIVRKFEPRVRLLQKKNGGQASALNAAISKTHGQIVSFLDGDDWFPRDKLSAVASALAENSEAAAVAHGYYESNEATHALVPRVAPHDVFLRLSTPDSARASLSAVPFVHNSAVTIRTTALQRLLPISEKLTFCADAPIAYGAMAMGLKLLAAPLHYYRLHGGNLHGAVDSENKIARQRKLRMNQIMFREVETLLLRLGVPHDALYAFLYPYWVEYSRSNLRRRLDTSRLNTLRTETASFRLERREAGTGYLLFKFAVLGMTLALPPALFYRLRDVYVDNDLGQIRQRIAPSRATYGATPPAPSGKPRAQ